MRSILLLLCLPFCTAFAGDPEPEQPSRIDESNATPVWNVNTKDPEMNKAFKFARLNFRYFWREVSWDRRRIIPGLERAFVKAPFSDEKDGFVEHMWITDVQFDGKIISGVLASKPIRLKSIKLDDKVSIPLDKISDWLYVIDGRVFGGYSVHAIRASMTDAELKKHDGMWGLDFGDFNNIRVCPNFGKPVDGKTTYDMQAEHPMSKNMKGKLQKAVKADSDLLKDVDIDGMNWLHQQALAGNTSCVQVLLDAGADLLAKTNRGLTAKELAEEAGWKQTVKVLQAAEAKR